jgi:mxaJ protein
MIRPTALLAVLALLAGCADRAPRVLRVCADPNNLPFSNRAGEGFENKLAELVAAELGAELAYTWWAQRRGNVRETLNAGLCDVIPGVASELETRATTRPYYRSAYVALSRSDRGLDISGFDDPRLRGLTIGVQMIGDDASNTPPAHALARRGLTANVRGYMIYGDYRDSAPQSGIVRAVASGEVDIAFVWGPVAGYFAPRQEVGLRLDPVRPAPADARLPMRFSVAMGTRRGDEALKGELDAILARRRVAIARLLAAYGVPLVEEASPPSSR